MPIATGGLDLDDLNWHRRRYQPWRAYGQTKLANLLLTLELERRLEADHSAVRAYAAHPGYAATNLQGHTGNRIGDRLVKLGNKVVAQSEEMGALPILFAATQELPGGSYVGPDRLGERRGHRPWSAAARRPATSSWPRGFWAASEQLTGVSYPGTLGSSAA